MGISKAASLLANPDASTRLAAWNGVQQVPPGRLGQVIAARLFWFQ